MLKLKMVWKFLVWCVKNIISKTFGALGKVVNIKEFAQGHVNQIKKSFRDSFAFGLLNCILSMMITAGIAFMFVTVLHGKEAVTTHFDDARNTVLFALAFDVILYVWCFVSVLYEKFLADHDHVFTILKDE